MRKLKFYLIGLVPGLLIVFFILNKKGARCSGYLPDSRVRAETLTKTFQFDPDFKTSVENLSIDEKMLRDSIITHGKIDFDRSHAQKQPCPDYILLYPDSNPRLEISFKKCKETATFLSVKKIR